MITITCPPKRISRPFLRSRFNKSRQLVAVSPLGASDVPSCRALHVPFQPPPVRYARARYSVQCGLHATVPDASCGRWGVLSHTSDPLVMRAARCMSEL